MEVRDCGAPPDDVDADPEFYMDAFNDQPWSCSFGTGEENGIWMNTKDQAGTIMAVLVWFLLIYSAVTITFWRTPSAGAREPREDHVYGSVGGAAERRADREFAVDVDGAQHVQPVPDVQAAAEPPLSDLQPLRVQDGPPLSVDEQLRRGGQSQYV